MDEEFKCLLLDEVMKEQGRTNKWLAKKINKSEAAVSAYRAETYKPRYEILYEIADALGVDVRQLFIPNEKSPIKDFKLPVR